MTRRVVITGLGAVTPLGNNVETYWQSLCQGKSGIGLLNLFDVTGWKVTFGGQVRNFDPDEVLDGKLARRLDRFAQFGLASAIEAVGDSGLDFSKEDTTRAGVMIGSGIGGIGEYEEQHTRLLKNGPSRISPFLIPKMMSNAAPGHISIYFGLRGPTMSVTTACASAANAVAAAMRAIQHDDVDIMVTGGSEAAITPLGLGGFIAARALSERNDAPQTASRPFDRERDGFVIAEGAGLVILEEYERAKKRGARIYGEMLGCGSSADAYNITAPCPDGAGAAQAMSLALRDAGINPQDVDYINAHGTSTPLGDEAETKAIKLVFGDHAKKLAVSSTKSMVGHLLGASGGVELVATILTIARGVIPPTINLDNPDPACDLDYVPNTARETRVRRAISNSFGFGGHNACLVVGAMNG